MVTIYTSAWCGYCAMAKRLLDSKGVRYDEIPVDMDVKRRAEMEQRSGQKLSPCIVVDGHMLPDISGEELENWLVANDRISRSDAPVEVPIDSSCQNKKQHVA